MGTIGGGERVWDGTFYKEQTHWKETDISPGVKDASNAPEAKASLESTVILIPLVV